MFRFSHCQLSYSAAILRCGRASRGFVHAIAISAVALAASGCSLNLGIVTLQDTETTGSISKPVSPLSPRLNDEDWRRAQAALVLAVDPQGNGAPVGWDNPESGHKGRFVAAGPLFLMENRICRPFSAEVIAKGEESQLRGNSCRLGPNEWVIREVRPAMSPN